MKLPFLTRLPAVCASLAVGAGAQAADVTKAAGGTDLAAGASWGGTAPTDADTAVWESTSLGAGLVLDSGASWGGIELNGASSDIDITGSGVLTLGAGGIEASAATETLSIANDIVLAGSQTWTGGSGLTLDGDISGSGTLTLDGSSAMVLSSSTFLTGTHQTIFTNANLSEVTATSGLMGGTWVNNGTPLAATGYFPDDSTLGTLSYWLEVVDGGSTKYTKGVEIELVQSGSDITARAIRAKNLEGTTLPVDFNSVGNTASLATSQTSGGYGGHTTTVSFGINTTIILSGDNTYVGGTVVNGGTVLAGAGVGSGGTQGGSFSTGDITINAGGTVKTTDVFVLGGGNSTTRTVNLTGGTANIQAAGPGGEYIRTLNLTGGTVVKDSGNVFFRTPNGGADVNSLASDDESTIFAGIDMTWSSLAVDVAEGAAADDLVISGNITENTGVTGGAKSLTKTGAGTLVVSGANSYTGTTTVVAGTLLIDGDSSAATGDVSVAAGAVLGGTGTLGGVVNAVAGSTVAPGSPAGTLTVAGAPILGGTLEIEIDGNSADALVVNGSLDVGGLVIRFSELSPPTQVSYTIVSATSLTGTLGTPAGVPAGYEVNVGATGITLGMVGIPALPKVAVLFAHAHPDDEGIFGGGVLPYYAQVRELPVAVVSMVTRSANGADPLTSGSLSRIDELRRAMDLYAGQVLASGSLNGSEYQTGNIRHVLAGLTDTGCCSVPPDDSWSDAGDGYGWGTSSGVSQVSPGLGNLDGFADARQAAGWAIARQIRRFRPEVIVTCHDLEGDYGHSNHTATAIAMIDAWTLAADAGTDIDGLAPWQAKKLYLRGGPDDNRASIGYSFSDPGFPSSFASDGGINPMFHDFFEDPAIAGQSPRQVADTAVDQHVSQGAHDSSTVFRSSENFDGHHSEWWTLYRSVVGPDDIEADFAVTGDTTGTNYTGWARGDFFDHLTVFPDRDGDGLPDAWELEHFAGSTAADPAADDDGDRHHNLFEFIAGLDPNRRDGIDFAVSQDRASIDFSAPAASGPGYDRLTRRYRLAYSPDLVDWSTVVAEGVGDGTPLSYLTGDAGEDGEHGFYRLELRIE